MIPWNVHRHHRLHLRCRHRQHRTILGLVSLPVLAPRLAPPVPVLAAALAGLLPDTLAAALAAPLPDTLLAALDGPLAVLLPLVLPLVLAAILAAVLADLELLEHRELPTDSLSDKFKGS